MISSTVVRSLYTGMTTDSSGSPASVMEERNRTTDAAPGHPRAELARRRRDGAAGDRRRAARAAGARRSPWPRGRRSRRCSRWCRDVTESIVLDAGRDVSGSMAAGAQLRRQASTPRCCCPIRFTRRSLASRAGIPERWGYRTDWRGALLTRARRRADRRASGRVLPAARPRAGLPERTARRRASTFRPTRARRGRRALMRRRLGRPRAARRARAGRGVRRREAVAAGVVRRARARRSRATASVA